MSLCRVAALKCLPVRSVVILHSLVLWDSRFENRNRVALSPGLGGVTDVASAIVSHELNQTKSVFSMLYFQRISSDYLEITTAVVVPCDVPSESPVDRYSVVSLHFLILWNCRFNTFI